MVPLSFSEIHGFPRIDNICGQRVKRLPAMQDTRVRSLSWEDLLEKEMATHSSIFAWGIPWMEEPGRLQSTGLQRVRYESVRLGTHEHSIQTMRYYTAM